MQKYYVTIPIAGHAYLSVEPQSENEAIDKALQVVTIDNVETWEALEEFNRGNFCFCPMPWKVRAEPVDADEPSDQD